MTEYVRHRLARTICHRFRDENGVLHVVTMDPAMEDRIAAGVEHNDRGMFIRMSPSAIEITCRQISQQIKKLETLGRPPVIVVSPKIRPALRQITLDDLPALRIMSYNEIARGTTIESVALVTDPISN